MVGELSVIFKPYLCKQPKNDYVMIKMKINVTIVNFLRRSVHEE